MPPGTFNPSKDIPDQSGKVFLITGGTAGVGAESVIELAKHNPEHIIFTGRKAESATSVIAAAHAVAPKVAISFVQCDLSDLSSVKAAAEKILSAYNRIDVLVANAGIMIVPLGVSKDGYETHFATNHVGHALLIRLLLPLVEYSASIPGSGTRIIMVSSEAYRLAPMRGIMFDTIKTTQDKKFGRWIRYGQSKLANLLYSKELARRYPNILSFSVTPGVVGTGLVTDLGFADFAFIYATVLGKLQKPQEGAFNHLWSMTTNGDDIKPGGFYLPVGKLASVSKIQDRNSESLELGQKLWDWTEKELEKWMK